jgi:hypothetical protein
VSQLGAVGMDGSTGEKWSGRRRRGVARSKGATMGRHSGAPCRACQHRDRVRDRRLIEHLVHVDGLGRSVVLLGSGGRPPRNRLAGAVPNDDADGGRRQAS